ncbi:translation initiation factor 2 subunit beta [Thermogladius calderae 1633]|uniref:Translation initiation factor 2 subunit beta n=2 Tax=Thermogladius calderae TaxID=1200300 RepID=I3TDH9_THEC1|nr:translation initiation factor 2 subunit beta [Thermogladius calderae 1633]
MRVIKALLTIKSRSVVLMSKRARDYAYEELLERAYSRLPQKTSSGEVFEVPKAEVTVVGGKTIITNFRKIADVLARDESLLQHYYIKELGVPAVINEAGQLVLQGKFNAIVINKFLDMFVKKYVRCPTCGSYHTKLIRKGKVFVLKCEACGAETTVEAFK